MAADNYSSEHLNYLSAQNSGSEVNGLQGLSSEAFLLAVVALEDLDPVVVVHHGRTDPIFQSQAKPGLDAQTIFHRSLVGLDCGLEMSD